MLNFLSNIFNEKTNARSACGNVDGTTDIIQECSLCDAECLTACDYACSYECSNEGQSMGGGSSGCKYQCMGTCVSATAFIAGEGGK